MLRQYGIPFFYKQATLIHEDGIPKIIRPSFSLPTYNNAVIDYVAGNNGKDDYERKRELSGIYMQNNIDAVLLNLENLNTPSWQRDLHEKLNDLYKNYYCCPASKDKI